jgi:hypothetical protein
MRLGKIFVYGLKEKERQMLDETVEAIIAWSMVFMLAFVATLASAVLGGLIE